MALLDRQGRLFGKFSILDIGAIATILIVLIGLLIVPGNGGSSIAQMLSAENKTVQVDMNVRGLSATNPQSLLKIGDKVKIIIRNQPRGEVTIKKGFEAGCDEYITKPFEVDEIQKRVTDLLLKSGWWDSWLHRTFLLGMLSLKWLPGL